MKRFYLIRHAMTQGNLTGCYIGARSDEDLCDAGRALLERCTPPEVDAVYASPMKRCIQTAERLYPGRRIGVIDELKECDFGAYEGKNYHQLNGLPEYQAYIDSGGERPFPGGESRAEFSRRCTEAFARLKASLPDGRYAFIVHGGTIMAIMEAFAPEGGAYFDFRAGHGEGYVLDDRHSRKLTLLHENAEKS